MQGAVVIEGNSQTQFAISGTAVQSGALPPGIYDVWCDLECFIKVASTASDVTVTTGYKIPLGNVVPVQVTKAGNRIGAVAAGAAIFSYHKTG